MSSVGTKGLAAAKAEKGRAYTVSSLPSLMPEFLSCPPPLSFSFSLHSSLNVQARDEEKNRRNNTDSTNQVMKDLEDLLPNRSLVPPAPPPEPGQYSPEQLLHVAMINTDSIFSILKYCICVSKTKKSKVFALYHNMTIPSKYNVINFY